MTATRSLTTATGERILHPLFRCLSPDRLIVAQFTYLGAIPTVSLKIFERGFASDQRVVWWCADIVRNERAPETTINDTWVFNIGRSLKNLPELKAISFQTNRRLLEVERITHDCTLGEPAFRKRFRTCQSTINIMFC